MFWLHWKPVGPRANFLVQYKHHQHHILRKRQRFNILYLEIFILFTKWLYQIVVLSLLLLCVLYYQQVSNVNDNLDVQENVWIYLQDFALNVFNAILLKIQNAKVLVQMTRQASFYKSAPVWFIRDSNFAEKLFIQVG